MSNPNFKESLATVPACEKARFASAVSNSELAVSTRAAGLLARPDGSGSGGAVGSNTGPAPLFGIGDTHIFLPSSDRSPLRFIAEQCNGITVFAGGNPVYSNPKRLQNCVSGGGQLLGAVGVSGDGVDEDEKVAVASIQGAGFCTAP